MSGTQIQNYVFLKENCKDIELDVQSCHNCEVSLRPDGLIFSLQ